MHMFPGPPEVAGILHACVSSRNYFPGSSQRKLAANSNEPSGPEIHGPLDEILGIN